MESIVRTSAASIASSASSIIDDSDPVTRDCYALRQRLLETERSLQNLTIKSNKVAVDLDTSKNSSSEKESIYQSDNAPVLTLADLTPTNSQNGDFDTNFRDLQSEALFPICSSFNNFIEKKDENRSVTGSRHSSASNRSDVDARNLHKKMKKLQEENVSLFIQNNKLLSELEKTTYQLQESKCQIKEFNELMVENQNLKDNDVDETIRSLNEQLENKDYAIRELEKLVLELRNHLRNQGSNQEHNRSLQDEIDENLKTIEELSESCQGYSQRERQLQNLNQQLEESKKKNEKKITELENDNSLLREEIGNVKTDNMNLQEQLASLKSELLSLQHNSSQVDGLTVENADLKVIVEEQQLKLSEYEIETSKAKDHMAHLEKLIQKIQEEKVSNSRSESSIGGAITEYSKFNTDNDTSSQRALIADLNLKLAMKDTELHKLQVLVASNTLNQNKMRAEYNYEGSSLHDLRAELCSVVEKTRIRDKKQIQLEQQITQLEEDLSGKKCQIIEMNERLADKVSLVTTLESKLSQRNRKLLELQKEVEVSTEKSEKCTIENSKLLAQANEHSKCLLENTSKIKELEFLLSNANKNISHLEGLLKSHEDETKETDSQFESVKKLHAEHCKEYEYQIENLQQQVANKSNHVITLETKMRNLLNEEKNRKASVTELKEYVQKMEQLLVEKKGVIEKYQENLQSMQDHSKAKSQHVADLQASLEQYKKELGDTMKQLQDTRNEQEGIISTQKGQIESLTSAGKLMKEDLDGKSKHISNLESSHNQNIEMLEQSQKHMSELEDSQTKNEREISSLKQTMEFSRGKYEEEISSLTNKLQDYKKQLVKYKEQVNKLSDDLNIAKSNNLLTIAKMKDHEMKLSNQSDIIKNQSSEIHKMNSTAGEIEKYIKEKEKEIHRLETEVVNKDETIDSSLEAQKELTSQLNEAQNHLNISLQKLADLEKEIKVKRKGEKDESFRKVERMLAITQEDLSIKEKDLTAKEKELVEHRERTSQMENIMNEQQWQLKQKAAEFTQLDIAYKNEKSEFEKKMSFLADDINGLKTAITQKDAELLELTKSCEALKIREGDKTSTIDIYEKKFQILEEENVKMGAEVKELNKELEKCKGEVKSRIASEEDVSNLKNDAKNMLADLHTLENQLMVSQQAVMELTQEMNDANALIKLKEADCTRLARELGASQVREAQVNARLNQDLRKVVLEEGKKCTKKNNEIDLIRNQLNELSSSSQQEIMQLKLNLQRSEDEKILYIHDLERYTTWINELEQNGKTLTDELQKERRKCKSLSESVVLQEAKAARYSTRMAGYKRAALVQPKLSPKSTIADLSIELDSTINTALSPVVTEPVKDSFDDLLKETAAELDSQYQNNSINNSSLDSPLSRPFNISSFHGT